MTPTSLRSTVQTELTGPGRRALATVLASVSLGLGGCQTLMTYSPQPADATQSLKFNQGIGTLTSKGDDHEMFMHTTFRTQPPARPTFSFGYANNSSADVNFGPENITAFYRGNPVPIYTYESRVAEIQAEKRGKQVALAILGGVAAVAAAQSASRQTYTTNYSGAVYGRRGYAGSYFGSTTTRVYDPTSGILAGAALGGATVYGIGQIEHSARAEEDAAQALLQTNTVEPQKMVTGQIVVKDCCEIFLRETDKLRFEVTVNGVTRIFEFLIRAASK